MSSGMSNSIKLSGGYFQQIYPVQISSMARILSNKLSEVDDCHNNVSYFDYGSVTNNLDDQQLQLREMVFLVKPELLSPEVDNQAIFTKALEVIAKNGYSIKALKIVSGSYIDKNDIVSRHFLVGNNAYRNGVLAISENALLQIKNICEGHIYGGGQLIEKTGISGEEMVGLWKEQYDLGNVKTIDHITNVAKISYKDKVYCVLNASHYLNVANYSSFSSKVVAIALISQNISTPWMDMRKNVLGKTDPTKALPGSLRNWVYSNMDELRVKVSSKIFNGFHLSDGPLSAMNEINVWFPEVSLDATFMGQLLITKLGKDFNYDRCFDILYNICKNPYINYKIDDDVFNEQIFYFTRGMNPLEAVSFVVKVIDQLQ